MLERSARGLDERGGAGAVHVRRELAFVAGAAVAQHEARRAAVVPRHPFHAVRPLRPLRALPVLRPREAPIPSLRLSVEISTHLQIISRTHARLTLRHQRRLPVSFHLITAVAVRTHCMLRNHSHVLATGTVHRTNALSICAVSGVADVFPSFAEIAYALALRRCRRTYRMLSLC